MSNKIAETYVELGLDRSKLNSGLNDAKRDVENSAKKMETDFKKLRVDIDTRIANMKVGELKKLYSQLKIQMEQKVKFGADNASLDKTLTAMDAVRAKLNSTASDAAESSSKIGMFFGKIGAGLAGLFAIKEVTGLITESSKLAAELIDLQASFKGTTEDLELMRRATAETVDEGDLIKLSNQAEALGISLEKQPVFFLMATNAAKAFGGNVEAGFEKIIRASEGQVRGIFKLGVERAKFTQRVVELVKQEGAATINELDAEMQKRIRLQAIYEASGLTMEDVKRRQATLNEQIKSVPALLHDVKESFGALFTPMLSQWLPNANKLLKTLIENMKEVAFGRAGVAASKATFLTTKTVNGKEVPITKEDAELKAQEYMVQGMRAEADLLTLINTRKKDGKALNQDQFEFAKLVLEIQMATYSKLYTEAKNYQGIQKEINDEFISTKDNPLEPLKKQQEELIKIDKLLKSKNITKTQENFLLERQKTLLAEIFKYEHPEYDINALERQGMIPVKGVMNKNLKGTYYSLSDEQQQSAKNAGNEANASLNALADKEEQVTQKAQTMASAISGGFISAIQSGQNFGQVLLQISTQLGAMIAQALLFEAVFALFNPSKAAIGSGGLFSGLFGKVTTVPTLDTGISPINMTPELNMNNSGVSEGLNKINNSVQSLTIASIKARSQKVAIYLDSKLLGESVTTQQDFNDSNNVKVNHG